MFWRFRRIYCISAWLNWFGWMPKLQEKRFLSVVFDIRFPQRGQKFPASCGGHMSSIELVHGSLSLDSLLKHMNPMRNLSSCLRKITLDSITPFTPKSFMFLFPSRFLLNFYTYSLSIPCVLHACCVYAWANNLDRIGLTIHIMEPSLFNYLFRVLS